ncbi:DNA repair protein RecN [Aeromicrobium sp. CTD01-1L150]|uniref:DNA repair protein RecN n=1 Tax=Aeromicrobium sp. CTD01-1L150 TaxID=3341830 RepID=UPI0035BFAD57
MWQHLKLSSLGVIDSAELELDSGFTVITGETGAGKTMVVTALGLLRGDRADLGLVRHGAERASVSASITVPEATDVERSVTAAGGELDGDVVVLGRVLSAQGRSRAVAGGATVPAALLTTLTDELLAVHGQSDQHRLLRPAAQRAALDHLAGDALQKVLDEYVPAFTRWKEIETELSALRDHARERAQELEMLKHGLEEVAAVEPVPGEEEELRAEEGRLAHAEALVRAATTAHALLTADDDGTDARTLVASATAALQEAAGHDDGLDDLAGRVREIGILLDEVGADLGSYSAGVEMDPARLSVVQERLAALTSLQRRYGPSLEDVLEWSRVSEARVHSLDHDDDTITALEAERDQLLPSLRDLAERLGEIRRETAGRLAELTEAELAQLSMPSAQLHVEVSTSEELRAHGCDDVELLFAANNGAPPRPLAKGASGGELSRLMLALEVVLADRTSVPTLVFDEVDAGIGGRAAVEVGRRLSRLAEHAQVLAVTHLPQVAAFADHHFHVAKDDDGQVTSSTVRRLPDHERVDELARMLAGQDDSAAAQEHARELLDLAERS